MMSSWKRAEGSLRIVLGAGAIPPWWPHFFTPGFWSSMWYPGTPTSPPDQVAHVRVAAVAGVGVGDDERTEVHLGRRPALLLGHPRAGVALVLVRGEQGADDRRGLVGHLAQRIAGEIRAQVLVRGALEVAQPPR